MRLLFGFKRTEAQHAIKRDKRDSRHGAHNLIPHCSTMRRRMNRWKGGALLFVYDLIACFEIYMHMYIYVYDWIGTIYVVWSGHGTMYSPYCQKMSTRDTRCLHRRTGGRYRCSVPPLWCSLSLFLFVAFICPPFDLCTAAYCYLFFFLLFWFVQNITIAILYTQRVKRSMNVMLLFALVGYFL